MSSNRAFVAALPWGVALAVGCGGLADGHYQGQPLAVIRGTLKQASPVEIAGETSFALLWAPAANHDAVLNFFGGAASVLDSSYTETCSDALPQTQPLCDGTAAGGDRICDWTDRRLGSLVRVVGYQAHLPAGFEIAIRDLPPESAQYDLSGQGGNGWFALASLVAFDDQDRDGAFRLGGPGSPPEPTLASSGRQTYDPRPGQPRRSYLIAFLDGVIYPEHIDPAFAEVLLFLPQGFSLWVEDEWLDDHGQTTASGRLWQPIDAPIELVMPTQAVAGCERGTRQTKYVSSIPEYVSGIRQAPSWCSDDRFRATWSSTSTNGCATVESRYSGDFSCTGWVPPAWDCPAPTTASMVVSVATTGQALDSDGYDIRLDGGAPQPIGSNARLALPIVSPGVHTVVIDGLAGNCALTSASSVQVAVAAGETAYVAFSVECWRPGSILVSVTTTGQDLDPDGYDIRLDSGAPKPIGSNASLALPIMSLGAHTVAIDGLAPDCALTSASSVQVTVAAGETAYVAFSVECWRLGSIGVTVQIDGQSKDRDGVAVSVDGDAPRAISTSAVNVAGYEVLSGGTIISEPRTGTWDQDHAVMIHAVSLTGVAANCAVEGVNPQEVEVVPGATTAVSFKVHCALRASDVRVTTTTSGVEQDQDGYYLTLCWNAIYYGSGLCGQQRIAANGSALYQGVPLGDSWVSISGLAWNCSASPSTQYVPVVDGQTVDLAFAIECVASGSIAVTTTTTGVDLDPDGYSVAWSWAGRGETLAVPSNGTTAIAGLTPGVYVLTLGGLAPNCDGPRTATATVVAGAATPVAFDVVCAVQELALVSYADGNPEIYLIRSSGTGATRLTVNPADDLDPAWSPDGARLAFRSNRDGNFEIYVMDADGSNLQRLTSEPAADYLPTWSPDGTRIAFVSERDGNGDIYVMNADGSSPARLTADPARSSAPDWSPDGTRIAFARGGRIYLMNADGSGASPLTTPSGGDWHTQPRWSPDGTKIAFSGHYGQCFDFENCEPPPYFSVINADGTGLRTVGGDWCADDSEPAWSPDGRHIAFTSVVYECMDWNPIGNRIRIASADGTYLLDIAEGTHPAWRP